MGVEWAEKALTPLAARLVAALEDPPEVPIAPRPAPCDLEAALLQKGGAVRLAPSAAEAPASTEVAILRADCEKLLEQRELLRA